MDRCKGRVGEVDGNKQSANKIKSLTESNVSKNRHVIAGREMQDAGYFVNSRS